MMAAKGLDECRAESPFCGNQAADGAMIDAENHAFRMGQRPMGPFGHVESLEVFIRKLMVERNFAQIVQKPAYEKFLLIAKGNTLDHRKAIWQ